MKLKPKDLTRLSDGFPEKLVGILVYGPDSGHVNETATSIAKGCVSDINDPFQVDELDPNSISEDPACLPDAVMAFSMTGGNRLVRIRNCSDLLTDSIKGLLKFESPVAKMVLQAGALDTRSKLRQLFEQSDQLGILACYGDQGDNLETFIKVTLNANNITADQDAIAYLATRLGGDRLQTKSELEKICLYADDNSLKLSDVELAIGDGGALLFDDIANCVADGNLESLHLTLRRSAAEGQNPIGVIRLTMKHFQRLKTARSYFDNGNPLIDAISRLRPPVFWNRRSQFERQVRQWSTPRLEHALNRLNEAEELCKGTGFPASTVTSQILLGLCIGQSKPYRK
ncbi:MAG: DNA polymerase III subunit delta [Rhodospirillaceae bacterium]|nr:DNA polymerase III subunit delta [Rhodospirillaceae bacterium]|tara:strand:+ start:1071 stop:2099 length:1029 start_codon:yes stop_codon:yes gene_type:complete